MKIVISHKSGQSYQVEVHAAKAAALYGLKIGDEFDGGIAGASGYKLKITGGSDTSGFPMRRDVSGSRRTAVLISNRPGFRPTKKGERKRKRVHGNQVDAEIAQLNTVVVEEGPQPLSEIFKKSEDNVSEKKSKTKEKNTGTKKKK
ncbi:MAG: 30S ribosomal protein S6e [Candidatus Anstonellales archaeon]